MKPGTESGISNINRSPLAWLKRFLKLESSFESIERDLRSHARVQYEIQQELHRHVRELERRNYDLEQEISKQRIHFEEAMKSVKADSQRQMINIHKQLEASSSNSGKQPTSNEAPTNNFSLVLDSFYKAFEDEFRGSPEQVREKLSSYLPLLQQRITTSSPSALDIGCGRGEWLSLIKSKGFQVQGVDSNEAMAIPAKQQGIPIEITDALSYLKTQKDESFDLISAFHVAEHLPMDALLEMLAECYRCLKKEGMVLFETPNPENVMTGSCNFYMDPTHLKPIPPAAFGFMLRQVGFDQVDCIRLGESKDYQYNGSEKSLKLIAEKFSVGQDYAVFGSKKL